MNTRTKIPIYYIDEEKDMELLVEQAVNSTFEENIIRYFQVLAFNYALAGIWIFLYMLQKKMQHAPYKLVLILE